MKQWEYKVVNFKGAISGIVDDEKIEVTLNRLAAKGWRLAKIEVTGGFTIIAVLEREIEE